MDLLPIFSKKINLLSKNPWSFFFIFLIVNALLSYSYIPLSLEIPFAIIGLLLPIVVMLKTRGKASSLETPLFLTESFAVLPVWIWGLVMLLAVISRFCFLTSFSNNFPIYDEVINTYYALQLDQKWTWYPFFFFSQLPPLYIWILAFLFKIFGFSMLILWIVPAVLSLAVVLAGYFALKNFFSKSFSFLVTVIMSVSFWPILIGRFSHQAVLMLFWEVLTFVVLGSFLRGYKFSNARIPLVLLGLCCGVGFYTYFAWPLVLLLVGGTVFWVVFRSRRDQFQVMWFLVPMGVVLVPLLIAAFQNGYGQYISAQFVLNNDKTKSPFGPLLDSSQTIYYLTVLFWKTWDKYYSYGPIFGGFLNPILSGAFFLGLVELWAFRAQPMVRWIAAAFFIFFIPVLFTNVFNALRLTPLIPFVILVTAVGVQVLLKIPGKFSKTLLIVLFFLSCGLDWANLEMTRSWTNYFYPGQKSEEEIQKYQTLLGKDHQSGPGFVFLNFTANGWDRSLDVMTHNFNVMENLKLSHEKVSWAALLTTPSFRPYLDKRLENLQWIVPNTRNNTIDKEVLVLIPVTTRNSHFITSLVNAYSVSRKINILIHERFMTDYSPEVIDELLKNYAVFEGDPFLETFYWEELTEQYQRGKDYESAFDTSEKGFKRGLVTPNVRFLRAILLVRTHRYAEAKKVYLQLAEMNPTLLIPPEVLRLLDQYIKTSSSTAKH